MLEAVLAAAVVLAPVSEARLAGPAAREERVSRVMIDNAKINTSRLLDHIADILKTQYGVREFLRVRKPDATKPVPPEMLLGISAADAIVAATGD